MQDKGAERPLCAYVGSAMQVRHGGCKSIFKRPKGIELSGTPRYSAACSSHCGTEELRTASSQEVVYARQSQGDLAEPAEEAATARFVERGCTNEHPCTPSAMNHLK